MARRLLVLLLAALSAGPALAQATDYFVDACVPGNAPGCGTASNPCKTITYVLQNLVAPPPPTNPVNIWIRATGCPYTDSGTPPVESFPLELREGVMLRYDASNSTLPPAVIQATAMPGGSYPSVILIRATGADVTTATGISGSDNRGMAQIEVNSTGLQGYPTILLASEGSAVKNKALVQSIALKHDDVGIEIRAAATGAECMPTISDVSLTTASVTPMVRDHVALTSSPGVAGGRLAPAILNCNLTVALNG